MTKGKSIKHKGTGKSYWKLKLEAMHKLGGKCIKCGETDIRVLQIAHKGTKSLGNSYERKDTKNIGIYLFKRIISGELGSDGVELLCSNCNILYEFEIGRRHFPEGLPTDSVELASKTVGKYKRSPKIEKPTTISCFEETKKRLATMFKEGTWDEAVNKMLDEFERLGGKLSHAKAKNK